MLGRLESGDERDFSHPMRALLPTAPLKTMRYWNQNGWWGDQENTSQCVAYSWVHYLEDGPITHSQVPPPLISPLEVYTEAQKVDEWPGEGYDGTSVRAGAKVLQSRKMIGEYLWAFSVEDVINAILTKGPVVVGTNWYQSMFTPDLNTSIMKIEGKVAGGHAYILNGVNTKTGLFRIKNSWGRYWANRGNALLPFDCFERLFSEGGEACIAVEVKNIQT